MNSSAETDSVYIYTHICTNFFLLTFKLIRFLIFLSELFRKFFFQYIQWSCKQILMNEIRSRELNWKRITKYVHMYMREFKYENVSDRYISRYIFPFLCDFKLSSLSFLWFFVLDEIQQKYNEYVAQNNSNCLCELKLI